MSPRDLARVALVEGELAKDKTCVAHSAIANSERDIGEDDTRGTELVPVARLRLESSERAVEASHHHNEQNTRQPYRATGFGSADANFSPAHYWCNVGGVAIGRTRIPEEQSRAGLCAVLDTPAPEALDRLKKRFASSPIATIRNNLRSIIRQRTRWKPPSRWSFQTKTAKKYIGVSFSIGRF
jgi:hypothetical protein